MDSFIERHNPRLFILAGMPGCGKSTWARTFFSPWQIVSSDVIREAKWPGEPYNHERNPEVFDEFHRRLGDLLEEGKDAVADATSLAYEARVKLLTLAVYHNADRHLIFFDNSFQALHRNAERTGATRVPSEDQWIMYDKHKKARSAILGELYTSITMIEATA